MAQLQSHNDALANSLRNSLAPTQLQFAVYCFGGLLLLALLNARVIWDYITSSIGGVTTDTANFVVSDQLSRFSAFSGNLFQGRLAPMLFWAFLGVVTYMIVWLFQNTSMTVRNDLTARDFRHPSTIDREHYWRSVRANKIFLVCSVLLFIVFAYFVINLWLPVLCRVFYVSIFDWHLVNSLIQIAWTAVATGLTIYGLLTVIRLAHNAWRSITTNF